MRFKSRIRSFSSSCVKGFGWFVLCSSFHVSFSLASLSVDEEHSILRVSPGASGTKLLGLSGTGFMAEEHQGISHVFCSSDLFLK